MASGKKELVINTQERAVSTDINRLQKFSNAFDANWLQTMFSTYCGDDDDLAGADEVIDLGVTTPTSAVIWSGLRVLPEVGSLSLLVTPGAIGAVHPDSAPDDSNFKRVNDLGVYLPGTLLMGAGATATRIDIIECTDVSLVVELDNRDLFDPATGLFVAQTITKAVGSGLQYRVRQGVPGNGFPGLALGWVPLAVASVPASATSNDDVTFWDVRPLWSSRLFGGANMNRIFANAKTYGKIDTYSSPGQALLTGRVEANTALSYTRLGGILRRGTPGTDGAPDLASADNQDGGPFTGGQPCYVYLIEPWGLPNWARYTDASVGFRVPRSPRGIIVLSHVPPIHFTGSPSAPILVPASTGLGGSTLNAVCIASGIYDMALGGPWPMMMDGVVQWNATGWPTGTGVAGAVTSSGGTPQSVYWIMNEGVTHPPNAKALWISFQMAFRFAESPALSGIHSTMSPYLWSTQGGFPSQDFGAFASTDRTYIAPVGAISIDVPFYWTARVPVSNWYPLLASGGFGINLGLYPVSFAGAFVACFFPTLYCLGWEV